MENITQIFKQNKWKSLLLFLVSSAFVVIGIFMLKEKVLMGWLLISLFGLCLIVTLLQFHPNASYLKLTKEGFEVKSLFRTSFTKWTDIKNFRKGHINGNKMIFFDYTDEHSKWKRGKKIAKFLSGKEGAIQSIYNISTEELMKLMIKYKQENK